MPTNQTTYNSRVTDEALEKKFRDSFKSQGGAELVNDLFASGVIVPVVDFSDAAAGSVLPTELQQAWDFATGSALITSTTPQTIINNTGFWKVGLTYNSIIEIPGTTRVSCVIDLWDGTTSKPVFGSTAGINAATVQFDQNEWSFIVFLRAGDSLRGKVQNADRNLDVWYRQIADVNGTLVNPLGFTSS